jgi:hypothetical protein
MLLYKHGNKVKNEESLTITFKYAQAGTAVPLGISLGYLETTRIIK